MLLGELVSTRLSGREMVVLEIARPSIFRALQTSMMPSSSSSVRSGAILTTSGTRRGARIAGGEHGVEQIFNSCRRCRSRKPGVFGEEMFTTKKSATSAKAATPVT